jgi:anti-sigma B factor antagonist
MSPTRTLNIAVRVLSPENTVIDLEGGIDLRNSHGLRATLFEKLTATSRLALNMSGIQYIDSSGIATLVEALKKARDLQKHFALFGLGPRVYDVLKLTNLLGVFQVFDTEEQALSGK